MNKSKRTGFNLGMFAFLSLTLTLLARMVFIVQHRKMKTIRQHIHCIKTSGLSPYQLFFINTTALFISLLINIILYAFIKNMYFLIPISY